MTDTSPKPPLFPALPESLQNLTSWLWLVVVAAGAYILFRTHGKRTG